MSVLRFPSPPPVSPAPAGVFYWWGSCRFRPNSASGNGSHPPVGASKIRRQKIPRKPRQINNNMKRFLQYLSESDFDIHQLDYDTNHGKSFRWAYTPKDQGGTFSIVTPSNGDAWENWKPVSPEHAEMLRDRWHEHKEPVTLHTFVAPHKVKQIEQHAV